MKQIKPSERINKEFPFRRINGMYDNDSDLQIMFDLILEELDNLQALTKQHNETDLPNNN